MPNQPVLDDGAVLVAAGWVETYLGISRQTRLELENQGVLIAIRLTPTSHRRYNRAAVEALANPTDPTPAPTDVDAAAPAPTGTAANPGAPEALPSAVTPKAGAPEPSGDLV